MEYIRAENPMFEEKENELKQSLRNFDVAWTMYE